MDIRTSILREGVAAILLVPFGGLLSSFEQSTRMGSTIPWFSERGTVKLNESEVRLYSHGSASELPNIDGYIFCVNLHDMASLAEASKTLEFLKSQNKPVFLALRRHTLEANETIAAKDEALKLADKYQLEYFFVDPTFDDENIPALFLAITKQCISIKDQQKVEAEALAIKNKPKPGLFSSRRNSTEVTLDSIWGNAQKQHHDNREKILAILTDYTKGVFNNRHHINAIKSICETAIFSNADEKTIMTLLQGFVASDKIEIKDHGELRRRIDFINAHFEKDFKIALKK